MATAEPLARQTHTYDLAKYVMCRAVWAKGATTVDDAVSRPGTRFGPFQLMRLMGRGGMGEVYEAEDTRKHRSVALKLISQEFSTDATFRAQMQCAVDTARRLRERHIVPIHDYGDIDGRFYIEMPMVDSAALRTLLTHYGPPNPARAVAIVRQIAAALDAAHARGVTHFDVKPENILVTNNCVAYLADFGIAHVAINLALSRSGTAVETYNYMAPERFTGDEVTHRSDIYALACVLSECLTGAPPYPADSVEQLIAAHLYAPVPRLSQLRPGRISPTLDSVVAKGMAKDPADRYFTAGDLAVAAHDALTTPEQHEETAILRQGNIETLPSNAAGAGLDLARTSSTGSGAEPQTASVAAPQPRDSGDATMSGPLVSNPGVEGLRPRRSPSTLPAQAAPTLPPWTQTPTARWGYHPSTHVGKRVGAARASIFDPLVLAPTQPGDKRKLWPIVGAVAVPVVVVIVAAGFLISRPSSPSQQASPAHQTTGQTVLPFNGLNFRLSPGGVAVDNSGTVYVTNQGMYGRVVALAAGSRTPTVEPFRGLYEPQGVAVDSAGTMYVTDFNNRVVALAAGSSSQIELPFTGLNYPEGVAVDNQGSVYVADRGNNQVVKLPAGSNSQVVVPFSGLKHPDGVTVDLAGNVYVTDTDNNRVVKLNAGSNNQTVLSFPRLSAPWGVAVDNAGDVFVTEHDANMVVKFAAGSSTQTVLPFTGLNTPSSVTVDKSGNVYVADRGDDSVLKLAP
jgi:serine/threonine-protein kinase